MKKNIQQLLVLSRLHKLDEETEKRITAMPITYDIEQGYLYNKAKKNIIKNMLNDASLTVEKIAYFTDTSVSFVKGVQHELQEAKRSR